MICLNFELRVVWEENIVYVKNNSKDMFPLAMSLKPLHLWESIEGNGPATRTTHDRLTTYSSLSSHPDPSRIDGTHFLCEPVLLNWVVRSLPNGRHTDT